MSQTQVNFQEMLDQVLSAGKDIAAQTASQTKGARAKGKEYADKGEDLLIEKLGLEDTPAVRDALRRGVGTGAAAGALAMLLSSKSGRKLATLGGLAGLGMVAYKAYEKNGGKMPNWQKEIAGMIKGPEAELRAEVLLRAMVAAAKADGEITDAEMKLIKEHDGAEGAMAEILAQEPNAVEIAKLADSEQAEREIYAVSCRIADGLNEKERDYLDDLAMALRLDPELAARIETDVRVS